MVDSAAPFKFTSRSVDFRDVKKSRQKIASGLKRFIKSETVFKRSTKISRICFECEIVLPDQRKVTAFIEVDNQTNTIVWGSSQII